jgi:hypothetical protein
MRNTITFAELGEPVQEDWVTVVGLDGPVHITTQQVEYVQHLIGRTATDASCVELELSRTDIPDKGVHYTIHGIKPINQTVEQRVISLEDHVARLEKQVATLIKAQEGRSEAQRHM